MADVSDPKKRRLDALKSRLGGGKKSSPSSKKSSTSNKSQNSSPQSTTGIKSRNGKSSALVDPYAAPSETKKENAAFVPLIKRENRDRSLLHPIYDELSEEIRKGTALTYLELSEFKQSQSAYVVESMLRDVLGESFSSKRVPEIIESRLVGKSVHLANPVKTAPAAAKKKIRDLKINSKRSDKHMSRHEHRLNSSFEIPPHLQDYTYYEGLNALWKEYIGNLIETADNSNLPSLLLSADFHGSILKVIKSSDPNFVGLQGIVVKETKMTFQIITKMNKLKILPKKGTTFEIEIQKFLSRIQGDEFLMLRQ